LRLAASPMRTVVSTAICILVLTLARAPTRAA